MILVWRPRSRYPFRDAVLAVLFLILCGAVALVTVIGWAIFATICKLFLVLRIA